MKKILKKKTNNNNFQKIFFFKKNKKVKHILKWKWNNLKIAHVQKKLKNLPQNPGDTIVYHPNISTDSQLFLSLGTQ